MDGYDNSIRNSDASQPVADLEQDITIYRQTQPIPILPQPQIPPQTRLEQFQARSQSRYEKYKTKNAEKQQTDLMAYIAKCMAQETLLTTITIADIVLYGDMKPDAPTIQVSDTSMFPYFSGL